MGATSNAETDGEKGAAAAACRAGEVGVSDSVAYKCHGVEGDGQLVPDTEKIVEVEHLLIDEKRNLPSLEATRYNNGCAHEVLFPENTGFKGLSQFQDSKRELHRLDASLEEYKLQLLHKSQEACTKYTAIDTQLSDHSNHSQDCNDEIQPDKSLQEIDQNFTGLNCSGTAEMKIVESCSDIANKAAKSESSVSETSTNSQPNFSIIEGEICLDAMSIRELHEAFRATFGRQTFVKDKLWLKRRIAMGLTNTCDIPDTNFIIKEHRIVLNEVKEDRNIMQTNISETRILHPDQFSDLTGDVCGNFPVKHTHQIEEHHAASNKRPSKQLLEQDTVDENLQIVQNAGKRARKPTRRYIEELSDVEAKECTGRLAAFVKDARDAQTSLKSQNMPIHDIGSWRTAFINREYSFGASNIRMPHATRARRHRRKNFMIFSNFVNMERGKGDADVSYKEVLDQEHGKFDSAGDNSDNCADIVPIPNVGSRRKHHRPWTLSEVSKLVEGVARYGAGRWSEIKRIAFASYSYRTSVDLKDKWRNLLRASFVQGSMQKEAGSSRKHASVPIPTPIMSRVRQLAEMQTRAGIEFGTSNYASHGGNIADEIRSGFL